jgi:hypothetical protein
MVGFYSRVKDSQGLMITGGHYRNMTGPVHIKILKLIKLLYAKRLIEN